VAIFVTADLGFFNMRFAMQKIRGFWAAHGPRHSCDRFTFSSALPKIQEYYQQPQNNNSLLA